MLGFHQNQMPKWSMYELLQRIWLSTPLNLAVDLRKRIHILHGRNKNFDEYNKLFLIGME